MKITRTSPDVFSVVTVDILADGSRRADYAMRLTQTGLHSIEQPGYIRLGGTLHVQLGPISRARVGALAVGETAEFNS